MIGYFLVLYGVGSLVACIEVKVRCVYPYIVVYFIRYFRIYMNDEVKKNIRIRKNDRQPSHIM